MTTPCESPIAWSALVDYWAGDLTEPELEALEEHVFACAACAAESARVAAVTEALRTSVPPLLTAALHAELVGRMPIAENPMVPGERREVPFPREGMLLHRLTGLDLEDATRVGFVLRVEGTERVLFSHPDAPFDRARGEVLLACQAHFAGLPRDNVAEVRVHDADGGERVAIYTILHRPPV